MHVAKYRDRITARLWLAAVAVFAMTGSALGAENVSLLGRLGIKPKYTSSYGVTRQETDWRQSLAGQQEAGEQKINFELKSRSREDESRNDFQEGQNRFDLSAQRKFSFFETLIEARADRQSSETSNSSKNLETNYFYLGGKLPVLQRQTYTLGLTMRAGYLDEGQVEEQARGRGQVNDVTNAGGWVGKLDLRSGWNPSSTLSWTGGAVYEGSQQNSHTIHSEVATDGTFSSLDLDDVDQTGKVTISNELNWTRYDRLNFGIASSISDDASQFYTPIEQTQESQHILRRTVDVMVAGQLRDDLNYGIDYSTTASEFDYEVQSRDRLDSGHELSLRGQHQLGLPIVAGTSLKAGATLSSGRHLVENTTAYDSKTTQMSGEAQRPFGDWASLGVRATVNLTQDFYDDGSLDKDVLRSDLALAAAYTPSDAFQASGGYTINRRETINIPSERSADNQVQYDYQVKVDYTALLIQKIRVRQTFQISTAYTYKIFDDSKNTLSRTNRVTTGVQMPLWERSNLNLNHIFHRSDTGAYTYPETGTQRVYGKGSETLRQNLKVDLEYALSRAIRVRAGESYDLNYRTVLSSHQTSLRDKLTFTGAVDFQHQFRGGLLIKALVERTSSSQEEDFWNVDAMVEKSFN